MNDAPISDRADAFESAAQLTDEHARLLQMVDARLDGNAAASSEAAILRDLEGEIREFIRRGAAAGAYIEDIDDRTGCQSLMDYWTSSLSRAGIELSGTRLAKFDAALLPDLKDKPCPYMGLDAFQDSKFFFGRDVDIEEVVQRLRNTPLVVVVGASGSGKSSLILGGVLPKIATQGWAANVRIVAPFVPGYSVLENLALSVTQDGADGDCNQGESADLETIVSALRSDRLTLAQLVGGENSNPTLITIDQFEEMFTLAELGDREALAVNLENFLTAGRDHRVVLTMREEFRARMTELQGLSRFLDRAWYSIRPMDYDELREAIEGPADAVNLHFQTGVIDDIAKKVLGQAAALPLLQFTLRSLWGKRDHNRITWDVYQQVGDPLNALQASADRFFDRLTRQTQDEAKRILLKLVRVTDLLEAYRQPVRKTELLKAGKANTAEVLRLLEHNDYVRIMPTAHDSDALVEVKHESLVRNWPRLVNWIDDERVKARHRLTITQAAHRWAEAGRPVEGLLTGWQLETAYALEDLPALEREFVSASASAVQRAQLDQQDALRRKADAERSRADEQTAAAKRYRRLSWFTAVLAFVVVTLVVWIAVDSHRHLVSMEDMQRAIAHVQHAASRDRTDQTLLVAVEAQREAAGLNESQKAVFRNSLLETLTKNAVPSTAYLGHDQVVRSVVTSPDGRILASAGLDRKIILRDARSGLMMLPPLKGHTGAIFRLAFSPDGTCSSIS